MKKRIFCFVAACLLLTAGCTSQNPSLSPAGTTTATATQTKVVGAVLDASMNSIVLRVDEETSYTVATDGAEMDFGENGLLLGDIVEVTVEGAAADGMTAKKVRLITAIGEEISTTTAAPTAAPATAPTEVPQPSPEPADHSTRAAEMLADMSLEEKVGQMFFVRCPESGAEEDIQKYHIGGYILFGRDFKSETVESVKAKIAGYQAASKIPLLIGTDEEGGIVTRISCYTQYRAVPFHSPQSLYNEGGFDLITSDAAEKAQLLLSLGVNTNFAPVSDVSVDSDDYIYSRTFGKEASETAKYVQTVVSEAGEYGLSSVLKHYPGYGNNSDTHTGFSHDTRSLDSFEKSDLIPFEAGIKAGADAILVNHNIVECLDDTYPASLSPAWHQKLRNELGFDGVIVTDDLVMDAIKDAYGTEQAAVIAVQAGNDMLLSTEYAQQIPAVIAAVNDGTISTDVIDAAVTRVLLWKLDRGIAS